MTTNWFAVGRMWHNRYRLWLASTIMSNFNFRACTTTTSPIKRSAKAGCTSSATAIGVLKGYELQATSSVVKKSPQFEWGRLWRGYQQIKRYIARYCGNQYFNKYNIIFITDVRINGHIFLSLNESRLERFNVSFRFTLAIMNIIEDMVSSRENL